MCNNKLLGFFILIWEWGVLAEYHRIYWSIYLENLWYLSVWSYHGDIYWISFMNTERPCQVSSGPTALSKNRLGICQILKILLKDNWEFGYNGKHFLGGYIQKYALVGGIPQNWCVFGCHRPEWLRYLAPYLCTQFTRAIRPPAVLWWVNGMYFLLQRTKESVGLGDDIYINNPSRRQGMFIYSYIHLDDFCLKKAFTLWYLNREKLIAL